MNSPTSTYNPLALEDASASNTLARVLCYGKPKTRKTWWAGTAAKTHRVTILDGENGTGIWSQLDAASRSRITRIPLATRANRPSMAMFIAHLLREQRFIWCLEEERAISAQHMRPERFYIEVDLNKLTDADVLVLDSWTRLAVDTGVQYMQQNNIDQFSGKKREFDHYGTQGIILDSILANVNCIPSHLVVIAHEHVSKIKIRDGAVETEITRMHVISSSSAHASKLPAALSDVLWFEAKSPDQNRKVGSNLGTTMIYTGSTTYRDGGARTIPPAVHEFPEWDWEAYAKASNVRIPSQAELLEPQQAFRVWQGEEFSARNGGTPASSAAPSVSPASPTPLKAPSASSVSAKPTFAGFGKK